MKPNSQQQSRTGALATAIALALASATVGAAEPKLRLVTETGPSAVVAKTVRLAALSFDPTTKTLHAKSRASNFGCGTPAALPEGALALNLDGTVYPLNTDSASLPAEFDPDGDSVRLPLIYKPSDGSASVSPAAINSTGCVSSNQFGTLATDPGERYDLLFEGQQPLAVAEAVFFNVADRTFDLRVSDPVLCTSYGSGSLTLALADPNNPEFLLAPQLLPGISRLDFVPAQLSLRPVSGTPSNSAGKLVQCSTPGAVGGGSPTPSSRVFFSSFEIGDGAARVALSVLAGGAPATTLTRNLGDSVEITVRVTNTGNLTAQNVRVREFSPLAAAFGAGMANVQVEQSGTDRCVVTGTSTECAAGASSLAFPLSFDLASLPVGESRDFIVNRRLAAGASGANDVIGFAAFVDPNYTATTGPDLDLSDNAAWATFAVS